ncbi:apolipoprotein D-like [Macrosteles quadrilineatus]|uniref:apolipoprotein D-like n=1 Tax=Macrosteles quadrilineatus TaxID=74068 RepID=UPI0023E2BB4A|nr:apolipoprotein D-like [Macrosteles quadrilineatus]
MKYLRTVLLVVAAAALARAQVPAFGWCPDYLTKADFDMEKYLGVWYEAERYVNVLEAGSRCVKTEYTMAKDGRILVSNEIQNRLTGIKRILAGEIRSIVKGTEAKLNVKYSQLPYPVETSYTVLDTDYDNYAVVWSCSGLGLFNTQNAWVMTRERNPSVTTLQKAYAVLDKYKIGRTFFVKTDQTECHIAEPADAENSVDKQEDEAGKSALGVAVAEGVEPVAPAVEVPAKPVDKVEDNVRKEVVEPAVAASEKVEAVPEKVEKVEKPVEIAKPH